MYHAGPCVSGFGFMTFLAMVKGNVAKGGHAGYEPAYVPLKKSFKPSLDCRVRIGNGKGRTMDHKLSKSKG